MKTKRKPDMSVGTSLRLQNPVNKGNGERGTDGKRAAAKACR